MSQSTQNNQDSAAADARKVLGEKVTFPNGMVAPNRFLKSAMTERLCEYDDENLDKRGVPTDKYHELYRVWGEGEIGVVVLGNIPVDRTGLEAKGNLIIDSDSPWDAVAALKPVIEVTKAHGSLVIGQLTHGGRQTPDTIAKVPKSSGDVQSPEMGGQHFNKPVPLKVDEIDTLVEKWASAAEVLYKAGADGAQLHSAHGYLLSQFLSSRVNNRTDDYGGELANKSRFIFRIIEAIKKKVDTSKFLIAIKLNSADFAEGGFRDDESKVLCKQLEEAGVDLIELSGGTYESGAFDHKKESTKKRESYFIEFADEIRPTLSKAVLAVTGGFRSAKAMAEAVNGKSCAIIGLARPLCAEPYLCKEILSGEKTAAKPNKVPNSLQTPTAIAQLAEIGSKKPISDLSDDKVAQEQVDIVMGKGDKDAKDKPVEDQDTSGYGGQGKESKAS